MSAVRPVSVRPLLLAAVAVLLVPGPARAAGPGSPPPGPTAPPAAPALPGADDPTGVPTSLPSLPGQGAAPAPSYSEPPDDIADSKPPTRVDPHASGLRLADGARLAPPKVLDISSVSEDMGGDERSEQNSAKAKFTLQAEVLFGRNSARLTPDAASRIAAIANEARREHARQLDVFGFTDDLGTYAHGKELSRKRAGAVQQELANTLGAEVTYRVRGYSEDYPIADNRTEAGRRKNRRVEVSFPRGG